VDADLDTFAAALSVRFDDALEMHLELGRPRPQIGLCPKRCDAELLTLAVIQALLGFSSETRFLRHTSAHLRHLVPYLPGQSRYTKRLRRAAPQLRTVMRLLAVETESWFDDTWLVDSTPVESGRSNETAHRSDLVGDAGYGYCASHSRYFWGLRLHLDCTAGRPAGGLRPRQPQR
jgi:hypothetical protein